MLLYIQFVITYKRSFKMKYNLLAIADLSKDNSTKVGAIITNQYGSLVSFGYNGLPRGMRDNNQMYQNKDVNVVDYATGLVFNKYDFFEHAERNAIYNFARENTKLNEDGNYIIMSSIDTMEDARCIVSIGVKDVYTKNINIDILFHVVHMFTECGISLHVRDLTIVKDSVAYNKLIRLRSFISNCLPPNVKMFDCLDQLNAHSNQYAAIFSKSNSLISIGWYGLSDYLTNKLEKYQESNHDMSISHDFVFNGYHENQNRTIDLKQSAVKNAVYNLLTNVFDFSQYKIQVSLYPCTLCYIGLISCGFLPQNIIVDKSALQATQNKMTATKWNDEYDLVTSIFSWLMLD